MHDALKRHWPEYLVEAAGPGLFIISACVLAAILEYPGSRRASASRWRSTPSGTTPCARWLALPSGWVTRPTRGMGSPPVWAWLLGPFALAHLRVYGDREVANSFLQPLAYHLAGYGVGSIAEIFDGDPPFTPRGCIAQAWSVSETLRAWREIAERQGETASR